LYFCVLIHIKMKQQKDLIKSLILDFQKNLPLKIIPRNLALPIESGKIISVCGVRRCGKTFVLYDTINKLLKHKVRAENILFINFDDERIAFTEKNLDFIIQSYTELFPDIPFKEVFFFFDEIQMAQGWEQFVRRVYDKYSKNIFISGSNSKLLATEIATSLRGRTIPFEVFPLSFSEFCLFKDIDTNFYLQKNAAKLKNSFVEFNKYGGFPEVVLSGFKFYEKILQEYFHIMLYQDMVERYEIKNIAILKYYISRMLANLSKPTSVNKIYNEIKSAGIKCDKNLLYDYADMLESIYFLQRLCKHDSSVLKAELIKEKKAYFIDNGMINALNYSFTDDFGKQLENTIFLWLRRQSDFKRDIYFYKGKKECDFILFDRNKPVKLIQSCWSLSDPDTIKREIQGLTDAAKNLKCKDLTIVTSEEEDEIKAENFIIKVVPAWKLLLEKERTNTLSFSH